VSLNARSSPLWPLLLLGVLAASHDVSAAAPSEDKRVCAAASEEAQLRRIQGKLRGAHEKLLVCARDVCPPLVKHDCEQWLAEVDKSLPTVVISARDGQGHDAGDVRVLVDGEAFLDKLDGSAAAIDPGEHRVQFQHGSDPVILQTIIVREGEKNRLVSVQFGAPRSTAPLPVPILTPTTPVAEARSPAVPILGYSLLGAGIVALGLAGYFEIAQLNNYSGLKNTCSPSDSCKQSDVDAIANQRIHAGVFLGAGLAAAGAGIVLLVTRASHGPTRGAAAAPNVSFGVLPTRTGGAASLRVSF
jgi:hypothetical protein